MRLPWQALWVLCAFSGIATAHDPDNPDGGILPQPGITTARVLIERVEAVYPEAARAAGLGATVTMELSIDEHGAVESARVVRPVGFGFDEAALAAARRLKFRPATKD